MINVYKVIKLFYIVTKLYKIIDILYKVIITNILI